MGQDSLSNTVWWTQGICSKRTVSSCWRNLDWNGMFLERQTFLPWTTCINFHRICGLIEIEVPPRWNMHFFRDTHIKTYCLQSKITWPLITPYCDILFYYNCKGKWCALVNFVMWDTPDVKKCQVFKKKVKSFMFKSKTEGEVGFLDFESYMCRCII